MRKVYLGKKTFYQRRTVMDDKLIIKMSEQLTMITYMLEHKFTSRTCENKDSAKIGRPTKEHIVAMYQELYPHATKSECVQSTSLNIKTVRKYWQD